MRNFSSAELPALEESLQFFSKALADFSSRGGERSDTRERILQAAFVRFAHFGLHGTSIRDLAGDVAITSAGFYSHFASKEELLATALARGYSEYLHQVPLAETDCASFNFALRKLCARHISFVSRNVSAVRLINDLLRDDLGGLVSAEIDSLVRDAQSALVQFFAAHIAGARAESGLHDESSVRLLAEVVMGLCEAHIMSPRLENELEAISISERVELIAYLSLAPVGAIWTSGAGGVS